MLDALIIAESLFNVMHRRFLHQSLTDGDLFEPELLTKIDKLATEIVINVPVVVMLLRMILLSESRVWCVASNQ